jgi:Protein of unknown function (DUF2905)
MLTGDPPLLPRLYHFELRIGGTVMRQWLIAIGVVLVAIGLLWPWLTKLGLGRLPGDIVVKRQNFSFYFPLVTCVIVSMVLSFILWLLNR